MLQERAALLRRLSSRFADRGVSAATFEQRAQAIEAQADILSNLVRSVGALGDPLAEAGPETI
jgi:hypothetical protein